MYGYRMKSVFIRFYRVETYSTRFSVKIRKNPVKTGSLPKDLGVPPENILYDNFGA